MSNPIKKTEELTVADLKAFPVWQFVNDDEHVMGETAVRPIDKTPVKDLGRCLIGAPVLLANGSEVWALIGNVDARSPRRTQHFLTLSVFHKDRCFMMARYHDLDRNERGPFALAEFLKLPIGEVFPISYDLSQYCLGEAAALVGQIEREPREKLTRTEIIALAVP